MGILPHDPRNLSTGLVRHILAVLEVPSSVKNAVLYRQSYKKACACKFLKPIYVHPRELHIYRPRGWNSSGAAPVTPQERESWLRSARRCSLDQVLFWLTRGKKASKRSVIFIMCVQVCPIVHVVRDHIDSMQVSLCFHHCFRYRIQKTISVMRPHSQGGNCRILFAVWDKQLQLLV